MCADTVHEKTCGMTQPHSNSAWRAIALPHLGSVSIITLDCVGKKNFFYQIKCRLSIACLFTSSWEKKKRQICVIEICFSKLRRATLFNDSMCGIIFAGLYSRNPFYYRTISSIYKVRLGPQRPQCIEWRVFAADLWHCLQIHCPGVSEGFIKHCREVQVTCVLQNCCIYSSTTDLM